MVDVPGDSERSPLEQRVADVDRDRTVTLLREHVVEGRLTLDEFSERMGLALEARTQGDLQATLADLPETGSSLAPEVVTRRRKARHWFIGVMSGAGAKGRWRVSGNATAIAIMGGCDIDLRDAEIDGDEIVITTFALMGGVKIIVPEGFDVDMNVIPFMGGRDLKLRNVPIIPGSPRIRIRGFVMMGGVDVRSRPRRSANAPSNTIMDRVRDVVESIPSLIEGSGAPIDLDSLKNEIRGQIRAQRRAHSEVRHQYHNMWREQQRGWTSWRDGDADWASAPSPTPTPSPTESYSPADLSDMAPSDGLPAGEGTVTILFSDMVNYAGLTEQLGDAASRELIRAHHQIVRDLLTQHGGREIKVQGDGFMIAFGGVARALRCACAMQQAFSGFSQENPGRPIRVHIGVHTGEAVEEDDDFLGHTVIVASRLADVAAPGEILVSALSAMLVERTEEFHFGDFREMTLKGLSRPHQVATLLWQQPRPEG